MQWADISLKPSSKTLRQFAGIWGLVFAALSCWQAFNNGDLRMAIVLAGMSITVGPLGLWKPQALRLIFVGWMILAFPIGWLVSRLFLAILFYGIFTPVGLLFRLIRRDVLNRRCRPELPSYWTPRISAGHVRSYFRQF